MEEQGLSVRCGGCLGPRWSGLDPVHPERLTNVSTEELRARPLDPGLSVTYQISKGRVQEGVQIPDITGNSSHGAFG